MVERSSLHALDASYSQIHSVLEFTIEFVLMTFVESCAPWKLKQSGLKYILMRLTGH